MGFQRRDPRELISEAPVSLVGTWPSTPLFLLRSLPLFADALFDRSSRAPCWFPLARSRRNAQKHRSQFFQTVGDIASLIAKPLAVKNQFTVLRHAPAIGCDEPLTHVRWHRWRIDYVPAQSHLRIDLVDVLPARPAAARKRKMKLGQPYHDFVVDDEHPSPLVGLMECGDLSPLWEFSDIPFFYVRVVCRAENGQPILKRRQVAALRASPAGSHDS